MSGDAGEIKTRTAARPVIERLLRAAPWVKYSEDGEDKLKISTYASLTKDELTELYAELKKFFSEDPQEKRGVSYSYFTLSPRGPTSDDFDGINIPVRLLEDIDEQKATEFLNIFSYAAGKIHETKALAMALKNITGKDVVTTDGASAFRPKQLQAHGYKLSLYELEGWLDPLSALPKVLNSTLGEDLFFVWDEYDSAFTLFISKENLRKLAQHPKHDAVIDILGNPREKCAEFRNASLKGKFLSFADRIIHPATRVEHSNTNVRKKLGKEPLAQLGVDKLSNDEMAPRGD